MDILLIDPPYKSLKGVAPECGYNVGLASLASFLLEKGFSLKIINGDALLDLPPSSLLDFNIKKYAEGQKLYSAILRDEKHDIWNRISQIIEKYNPLAIGITYFTPSKHVVYKVASIAKKLNKNIKVIAGGHHPSYCADEVMKNVDIDFVVKGEGENALLALMTEIKRGGANLANVQGIYWRDDHGKVIANPDATYIKDLDTLPFLARDAVFELDYRQYRTHRLTTSRGCPYQCTFCADKILWRGKVRHRSVENVISELEDLKNTYPDLKFVEFTDGTFTYDKNFVEIFCQKLIEKKINIKWRCTARYDDIDAGMLNLMKKANCFGLYLGVESGSERILEMVSKGISLKDIIEKSEMVQKIGIVSIASILIGIPGERKEDIRQTLDLMKRLKVDLFDVNSYVPLPGTPLYNVLSAEQKNIDWSSVAFKSLDNYFNESVSRGELKKAMLEAYTIAERTKRRFVKRSF